jgi:hypothetical protein
LDIAYNIKLTFPSCYKKFFELWDFITFFNKFFNTIRSIKLKERIKILFFNDFLIKYIQPRICSCNLKIIRSTIQYIVLMISLINDIDIINLIYNFLFGFNDSKTNYVFHYNINEETAYFTNSINNTTNASANNSSSKDYNNISRTKTKGHSKQSSLASISSFDLNELQNIYNNTQNNNNNNYSSNQSKKLIGNNNNMELITNTNFNINSNKKINNNKNFLKESIDKLSDLTNENLYENKNEEKKENFFYENQDYNYIGHNNIAIGLKIFNNMNNSNESINLVISVMFEKLFEKVPISMFNRLIFPFAEFCTKEIDNPLIFNREKSKIPDMSILLNLIKIYEDHKEINAYFEDNIIKTSFKTLNHYIKNDFDFYFYYLNARQDQENFDYLNEFNNNNEENKNDLKENLNFFNDDEKKTKIFDEFFHKNKENKHENNRNTLKSNNINSNNLIQTSNNRSSVIIAYNNMNEISIL